MQRTLVAAFDLRGLLGVDGRLPWTLPAELAHFRALTLGRPVVMGRSTFETLRRPLDGRLNIVLSTRPDFAPRGEGVCVVRSLEEAWARVERVGADGCSVIGGARVYEAALDVVDPMALTQGQHTFEGRTEWSALTRGGPCEPGWRDRLNGPAQGDLLRGRSP